MHQFLLLVEPPYVLCDERESPFPSSEEIIRTGLRSIDAESEAVPSHRDHAADFLLGPCGTVVDEQAVHTLTLDLLHEVKEVITEHRLTCTGYAHFLDTQCCRFPYQREETLS